MSGERFPEQEIARVIEWLEDHNRIMDRGTTARAMRQLREERDAEHDRAHDLAVKLAILQDLLGVEMEPHQTVFERMAERARELRGGALEVLERRVRVMASSLADDPRWYRNAANQAIRALQDRREPRRGIPMESILYEKS